MKKLIILFFVVGIAFSSSAQLEENDVLGNWKYTVETDQGQMTGVLKFKMKEGKLTGQVLSDDGGYFDLTKIELKKDNILYFELQPDYEVIKVSVKVDGDSFKGTGGTTQGEFALTGKKVVDP